MTENQRLKEVQKRLGFSSQIEFATVLGIKQGSLSDIYREKNGIGVSNSIKMTLFKDYSINIDWLETGEGEWIKNTGSINIKGDNKGVANTGVIHGDAIVGNKYNGKHQGDNINYNITEGQSSTKDINNLFDSYNKDKGVEIERLQDLYTTMLNNKEAIIKEKYEIIKGRDILIQELKEQIKELREDKCFLKEALQKNQM